MERHNNPPEGGELQDSHTQPITPCEQLPQQTPQSPDQQLIDQAEENESQLRQTLLERITAAGVTTLGHLATITTATDTTEHPTDHQPNDRHHQDEPDEANQDDEPDIFPWHDAARWNPDSHDDDRASTRLEALFTETPDQQLGTTQHMGWFGLLTQDGLSGGFILSQNSYGHRSVWATDSDERLAQYWEQLQSEYDAFMRATGAQQTHTRAPATQADNSSEQRDRNDPTDPTHADHQHPPETTPTEHGEQREQEASRQGETNEHPTSPHYPEIWVGSLSDYNDGHLHGTWLDATLEPDDLYLAIQFILRTGHDPTAEEWAIMDYDDFCGLRLGEYEPLEAISRIANGISEHGEAFAKWVEYVGERSEELLTDERFQDHYLGYFESTEAYVENLLEETDAYSFEEFVPEWLRPYVKIDVELLARDSEIELYIAEAEEGGVFVFDGRG